MVFVSQHLIPVFFLKTYLISYNMKQDIATSGTQILMLIGDASVRFQYNLCYVMSDGMYWIKMFLPNDVPYDSSIFSVFFIKLWRSVPSQDLLSAAPGSFHVLLQTSTIFIISCDVCHMQAHTGRGGCYFNGYSSRSHAILHQSLHNDLSVDCLFLDNHSSAWMHTR